MRLEFGRQRDDVGSGGEFQIEDGRNLPGQGADVGILHMAPVLTQVSGDAVGSGDFACGGGGYGVRFVRPSCLADGGDMIDVDIEPHIFLAP